MKKTTIELAREAMEKVCAERRNNPKVYLRKRIKSFLKENLSLLELQEFMENQSIYYPLTVFPAIIKLPEQCLYQDILLDWGFDSRITPLNPNWLRLEFKLKENLQSTANTNLQAFQWLEEAVQFSQNVYENNWWIAKKMWNDIVRKIESQDYMIDPESETIIVDLNGNIYRKCVFESSRFQFLQRLALDSGFSSCQSATTSIHLRI